MQMLFLAECAMYEDMRRSIFTTTKLILGLFILIYFGAKQIVCDDDTPPLNENIAFCNESLKELKDDVKDWQERCLNEALYDRDTPCCNAEKKYDKERRRIHGKLCFYKGN